MLNPLVGGERLKLPSFISDEKAGDHEEDFLSDHKEVVGWDNPVD